MLCLTGLNYILVGCPCLEPFRSVCTVSVPIEIAVNELAEKYRLVKGGTIRSEATKDKVRTLAPAVYANEVKMTVP